MTTTTERPNVTGKGPILTREIVDVVGDILSSGGAMAIKLEDGLAGRAAQLEKINKMAYLKTVKAGETAWDLKQMALELKTAVQAGDESGTDEILASFTAGLDHFIHKIKTFVVRMT
jgi:hypothetical protein